MQIPSFLIPFFCGLIIQIFKLFLDYHIEKKFDFSNLRRSGGFPSVHSGIASSITTLMFLLYGYGSGEFTIAFGFSILFWYDSMTVRYEAGKHAKYLNTISLKLRNILHVRDSNITLKERLGHTFVEVIGGITIGFIFTFILFKLNLIGR